MRRLLGVAMATLLVLMVPVPAAGDSPWDEVVIEVEIHYDLGSPQGPFVVLSGNADGLICESGETIDLDEYYQEWGGGPHQNALVYKEFDCDDGSFVLASRIIHHGGEDFQPEFEMVFWQVVDGMGTGDYEDLRGHGTSLGEGTSDPDVSIETFTGVFR